MTKREIRRLKRNLMRANVPLCEWGQGQCKTMLHLIEEINAGESVMRLQMSPSGILRMYRYTRVILLKIFYHDPASLRKFRLVQKESGTAGNEYWEREHDASVSEKLKRNEAPDEKAVNRAIFEELNINDAKHYIIAEAKLLIEWKTKSYRGIITQSEVFPYTVLLTPEQYKAEGYIETQPDGTVTHFIWREAIPSDDEEYVVFTNRNGR